MKKPAWRPREGRVTALIGIMAVRRDILVAAVLFATHAVPNVGTGGNEKPGSSIRDSNRRRPDRYDRAELPHYGMMFDSSLRWEADLGLGNPWHSDPVITEEDVAYLADILEHGPSGTRPEGTER